MISNKPYLNWNPRPAPIEKTAARPFGIFGRMFRGSGVNSAGRRRAARGIIKQAPRAAADFTDFDLPKGFVPTVPQNRFPVPEGGDKELGFIDTVGYQIKNMVNPKMWRQNILEGAGSIIDTYRSIPYHIAEGNYMKPVLPALMGGLVLKATADFANPFSETNALKGPIEKTTTAILEPYSTLAGFGFLPTALNRPKHKALGTIGGGILGYMGMTYAGNKLGGAADRLLGTAVTPEKAIQIFNNMYSKRVSAGMAPANAIQEVVGANPDFLTKIPGLEQMLYSAQ